MAFQTQSATATAPAKSIASGEPWHTKFDFYSLRDDMVRAYLPATEEERYYVTQIARFWYRLQRLLDAESAILDQQPLPDLFASSQDRFKTLHRAIGEAERMWRNAVEMFQKARARRERTCFDSPRRYNISTVPSRRPSVQPEPAESPVTVEQAPPVRLAVTKRTQTSPSSVATSCSPTSTTSLQSVEKHHNDPVSKCKPGLN